MTTMPPTTVVTRALEELQICTGWVAAKQRWARGVGCAWEDCSLDVGKPRVMPATVGPFTLGLVAQRTNRMVSGYL